MYMSNLHIAYPPTIKQEFNGSILNVENRVFNFLYLKDLDNYQN